MEPLTKEQEEMLSDLYYDKRFLFGRDKLFAAVKYRPNHPTQRQVNEWLKKQKVHQLHRRQFRSNTIKPVVAKTPNSVYQMDIADMGVNEYNGYRYILAIIDVYSRQVFAEVLKKKSELAVVRATSKLIREINRFHKKVKVIQTDNGGEFINPAMGNLLKKHKIHHITTIPGKPMSNGIIERFNQTLKGVIKRDLTARDTKDWVTPFQQYINNYNTAIHATIEMTPDEADEEPAAKVAVMRKIKDNPINEKDDIDVGDSVRLKKFKGKLDKHSDVNWSRKVYTIERIVVGRKPFEASKYYVDGKDKAYSRNDLLKIEEVRAPPAKNIVKDKNEWVIEKITDKKKVDGKMQYEVYWVGYKEPTWEPYEHVKDTEAYALFTRG